MVPRVRISPPPPSKKAPFASFEYATIIQVVVKAQTQLLQFYRPSQRLFAKLRGDIAINDSF